MKKFLLIPVSLIMIFIAVYVGTPSGKLTPPSYPGHPVTLTLPEITEIVGLVKPGESLYDIFKRYSLPMGSLFEISRVAKKEYNLKKLRPLRSYIITKVRNPEDDTEDITLFRYSIDDSTYLKVVNRGEHFTAERVPVSYERRHALLEGEIDDNLITAVGESPEHLKAAFNLAEIFEAEIDFLTELRKGDRFRMVIEELWKDGIFKGFGDILLAEFWNNGRHYEAYRYEVDGLPGYYDPDGRSMKKALLRAPLRFRHISSRFSYRRKHPVLKIYRPHLGVDYAAPTGTPVSAAGNGTVIYAGWKGAYGKCVIIRHPNGYVTYYGHLSKIKTGIRKGKAVSQGQVIGYVGMTGLATGPHLDYRVKKNGRFINPLSMSIPRGKRIPSRMLAEYKGYVAGLKSELAELQMQRSQTLLASD